MLSSASLAPMATRGKNRTSSTGKTAAGGKSTMFRTRMDMPEADREALVRMLNRHLANSFDLYTQTKHAHWNVKGMDFYQLHLLFDELAEIVEGHADTIAERITALGGVANGTVRMAADNSEIPEFPVDETNGMSFVEALADRYARHDQSVRAGIDEAEERGDKVTADMLTEIAQDVEKALYFLEAHLQGRKGQR